MVAISPHCQMAPLQVLPLCFLFLAISPGSIHSGKMANTLCMCRTVPVVPEVAPPKQPRSAFCVHKQSSEIVSFTHKVAIFAQHGKNITLTWKGNIFIKDMKEEFCFDMERHPEGRHFNTQARNSMTRDNNDRISLARDNTSFTLNVKEAQYADQGNYTCTLYFDDGEGSLIIELKVVDTNPECSCKRQSDAIYCTSSGEHLEQQLHSPGDCQGTQKTSNLMCLYVRSENGLYKWMDPVNEMMHCCPNNNTASFDPLQASTAPLNSSSVTNLSSNPTVWLLMIIPLLLIVFLLFLRWKKGAMKRRNTSSCLHPSRAYRFRHIESQSQISFSTEVH
ncbi:uncharacterized protein LOC123035633 [Varanus komodoensis]|uniref:uncharacterized protein LOC123035633 n=1 Tax=Varanus komodoensis TaxID=61221 RepID=UPI001CF7C74E|nr:uncharacterized protein LOC123035633 [Varanus komodoensis]